ncbi:MAG: electron transfer flavoprotein subunit beta/FixA family protein [Deltaproteobacteria bacterium]|nr:electron transfer flavoprotein subunit beta/FixA family protein [Deltaproteobacteria bacterium]
MDIIACIKMVPDASIVDTLKIDPAQKEIEKDGLIFKINEWDEYVLEAATRVKEKQGGTFTAITAGPKGWDEILKRALAMTADRAIRIDEDFVTAEPSVVARVLAKVIEGLPYDLVLFGAQSEDFNSGQLGCMVAEMLGIPHATMIVGLEVGEKTMQVKRELEAGAFENYTLKLPALLTIQTGINQPRYLSVSAIRRSMKKELQIVSLDQIEIYPVEKSPMVKLEKLELPPQGKRAEIISGSPDESAEKLARILKSAGIL